MNVRGIKKYLSTGVTDANHWEFSRDYKRQTEQEKSISILEVNISASLHWHDLDVT